MQAVHERATAKRQTEKKSRKKVKKLLKNLLTNARECGILFGHFRSGLERGAKKLKKVLKNPLTNATECGIIARLCKKQHASSGVRTARIIDN